MTNGTLINDRKSRKRELDRKSQRLARQRTRSRMAHLETLVANFRETDSDVRFSSLNEQLSKVISERDGLRSLLESLNFTIRSHLDETSAKKPFPSSARCKDGRAQSLQSRLDVPDFQETSGNEAFDTAASMNSTDEAQAWHNPESLDLDPSLFQLPPLSPDFLSTIVPQIGPPRCECMLGGGSHGTGTTLNIWRQLNDLHQSLANIDLAAEDRQSEDSVIRAVLYGWNCVTAAGQALNTCRMLRSIDELSGLKSSPTDRLAILSLIRLMLVSQSSTRKAALPRWLHARPSQNLPHAIAIDFVFWPGIRERLVFSEHEYCTDSFWRSAVSDTKLLWPLELSDAYVQNSMTGDLHLSPYFRTFIRDLSNWTVSPEFLKKYPELYNDIKGY
ncbi:uncharacterized protein FFB20_03096 [Fusarium fujikuroi]|uniref:Uncharacterized protein n=1 Tax=Fusarium fujikuroi TaxID=5127 RepID=A0A2H3SEA8_FUSFU|nr:uncharacterized protein FFB20_03096 [Fusarium fujikuroi]SCO17130.1 uncharacterized protein FFE2_13729 [Fusarium fujikuroi]SCO24204.1 uncharacterized protein FFC1_15001 [Fusarium fujikuroi]SCO51922.1 uncharacterized protein FFNC_14027 [Fusarium fujikuroi]SCV59161.1 uncharacterized protein FFFS_13730 [Fusarium fujikuroi]